MTGYLSAIANTVPFDSIASPCRSGAQKDALPDAQIHMSYGVGFRFSLERTAVFRADVGFSPEGYNVTAGYGLSF